MYSEPEQHEGMTLERLCDDCLYKIFSYLSLSDLLNVADTSKQLKRVADLAFHLKHGRKIVSIHGFTSRPYQFEYPHHFWIDYPNYLITSNLKIMLPLIRCFGHLISRMEIELVRELVDDIHLLDINFERLMLYVKKYCIETLIEFTLLAVGLQKESLRHFVKPFPNIHSVSIQSSDLKNLSLLELFPKVRRLTYYCEGMDELVAIGKDLQNLDHLEIKTDSSWERWDPSLQRSISQLQSLAIPHYILFPSKVSFDSFSNLQELKLNAMHWMKSPIKCMGQFHLTSVNKFRMYYPEGAIPWFPEIPFSFDHLIELDLKFNANNTYYLKESPETFYDYILRHPTILKLRIVNVPGLLCLHKLMNMLPLLEEVELIGAFANDDIIHFMNKMKVLKKLKIRFESVSETLVADVKCRLEFSYKWHGKQVSCNKCKFTRVSK